MKTQPIGSQPNKNLVLDQMMTPQGKLTLSALVKSLHLTPETIIVVQTDADPNPILEALQQIEIPFTVPIIVIKRDENLMTCSKKELEDALEIRAREEANG